MVERDSLRREMQFLSLITLQPLTPWEKWGMRKGGICVLSIIRYLASSSLESTGYIMQNAEFLQDHACRA